ncbi:hypothetical protein [Burkholderia sp. TSV86]|uniref:hypothetical protein n=1 Tax=Burkholderia sp. TSV86 TaxID=1385594 RepID=UPI00075970BE|nr:hypothetical protein [Burkholderia sp. TSV86]KVE35484.1 hypothetical protein WS68_05890 [Burkholderia sp. TSV86]
MDRTDLLKRIQRDGSSIVDQFLPFGARAELDGVIRDGHHEIDASAWLMFVSIRAILRNNGMGSCESDHEASQIMALLNA